MSSTSPPLRSFHGSTDQSESLSPRTLPCARITFFSPAPNCRERNISASWHRRTHRRLGFNRALLRLGRGQRPHECPENQKWLAAERQQDILHKRPLRRRGSRNRGH